MRLRVLLCTNSRDRGSTSRTLEAWVRLLPQHGVHPTVSVGGDGPLRTALGDSGVAVYEHPIREFFDRRRPLPFLKEIARLAIRIRRSRIDLVHLNEHEHYPVVARAAYLAGVPTVVHVRFRVEAGMCQWLFKPPYTPKRVFFTSETQMADVSDAVASAVPRDRWRLIYNGLDLDVFGRDRSARNRTRTEWGLRPSTIAIGTASSISPRKRLDQFLRVIAELVRSGLDVRGFIAGQPYFPEDEAELASLRALAHSLAISDYVAFLGYVEPVEPLYHAWDVCVSTSAYETFGMTVLEAMACRCPVIAYPGGSVAEVVRDGGTLIADNDLAALVDAVRRVASDPVCRADMGARARARAEHFDIRRSVAQLAAEYRAVTGGRSFWPVR
jgi:glycosyltransferase involved in cell wall biosynthesis